jgi:hypothetical protein
VPGSSAGIAAVVGVVGGARTTGQGRRESRWPPGSRPFWMPVRPGTVLAAVRKGPSHRPVRARCEAGGNPLSIIIID